MKKIINKELKLFGYLHEDLTSWCETYKYRPAIIICPGGAYSHLSPREEDPVAMPFFVEGYQVFILEYTVGKDNLKVNKPEEELAKAVKYLKDNSKELLIDSSKIAILGFSAGGHVVASLSTHWPNYGEEYKPDVSILCYPVITTGEYRHKDSIENLTSGDKALIEYYSLENQVNEKTIPSFIWSTFTDESVNIKNTLLYVEALTKYNVPYEVHIFNEGKHGLSLGYKETGKEVKAVQPWFDLCIKYLSRRWDFSR